MSSISKISIDQQLARIAVEVTPAQLKITNQRMTMSVNNEMPEMSIEWEKPTFELDWQQVHNESGLKSPEALTASFRDASTNHVLSATQSIASDGNYMADLTQKGPRIAQLARRHSLSVNSVDTNIQLMPKKTPEVKWDKGSMNINWDNKRFKIEWEGEYMPQMVVDPPYSVEIYLKDKPYFRVTVEDSEPMLFETGRIINEYI